MWRLWSQTYWPSSSLWIYHICEGRRSTVWATAYSPYQPFPGLRPGEEHPRRISIILRDRRKPMMILEVLIFLLSLFHPHTSLISCDVHSPHFIFIIFSLIFIIIIISLIFIILSLIFLLLRLVSSPYLSIPTLSSPSFFHYLTLPYRPHCTPSLYYSSRSSSAFYTHFSSSSSICFQSKLLVIILFSL